MTEATEKQINFANSLGIAEANSKSKETLKVLIDEKLKERDGNKPKVAQNSPVAQIGATSGLSEVKHLFQNAYEFGKAGNRQTIRYWNVEELKTKVKELRDAGFLDEDEVEMVKM